MSASEINASSAKIDEQVYLLNYARHYAPILGDRVTQPRLAELFLFRAWAAQFGYRIFSTDHAAAERLIGETVNASKYLGLAVFERTHGFSIEAELGADFISLIEDRWRDYDVIVSTVPKLDRVPTIELIGVLTHRLGLSDPNVTYELSMDFLRQLDLVKSTAQSLGS